MDNLWRDFKHWMNSRLSSCLVPRFMILETELNFLFFGHLLNGDPDRLDMCVTDMIILDLECPHLFGYVNVLYCI